jgi:hypothetical protein
MMLVVCNKTVTPDGRFVIPARADSTMLLWGLD